jgi:hypothetical protein
MSLTRTLATAALLGTTSLLRSEEAAPAPSATDNLTKTLDPVIDVPPAGELPPEPAPAVTPATPSPSVTVNLINRLVEKKVLSREEADEMIRQAEADAVAAQNAAAQADIAALPPVPGPDDMRVTYIPEVVKNNMRDEIKQELMAQAREEKWSEKKYADWTTKFRPFGDIRARSENIFFPTDNAADGSFPNFNAINSGSPYDASVSNPNFAPQYNTDQDRHRARLRVRFGTDIMLGDGFSGGIRISTGDSREPISPNQSLGDSGGNFSKYAIWLDRGFISYDAGPGHGEELIFLMGRFDNPFMGTDIAWDEDLGFDGLAVRGKVNINDSVSTFFTAGYFPVFNTDFNYASNQPKKFESNDKWLTGAQLGINWKIKDDLTAKVAVAYYDFSNISGELSSLFIPLSANDAGDTDATRPSFAQRGNTYMELRNIDNSTSANDFGNNSQFQYYGLASEFRELALTGRLDYDHFNPFRISLIGEVIENIGFDEASVRSRAVGGNFDGGSTAWNIAFMVGKPALAAFGDWQASIGYRRVESDAVVDGFADSDFGGGGTNVQGFSLIGSMALTPAVQLGLTWLSASEVSGPPVNTDTLQIDLNARF